MKILCTLTAIAALGVAGAYAGHDRACTHSHGKVTVVTPTTITVDDQQLYKVGDTTRVKKGDEVVKAKDIKVGDIVCLDTRGKNDMGKEIAGVTVLSTADAEIVRDKQLIRETEKVKETEKEKVRETE
jgi:hypothetical protein